MEKSSNYPNLAFTFIEALASLNSVDQVLGSVAEAFGAFGFENFVASIIPRPRQRFKQVCFVHKWPPGWFELYEAENYVHHDPVARKCRETVDPFEWKDARYDISSEPISYEIMNRAADFGMKQGFCLPIHGLNGFEACISLSGSELDLDPKNKPALHLMSMYAFEKLRILSDHGEGIQKTNLTPREREVLNWAAAGKSAWETGQILDITKRTVDQHVVTASSKLGASNKTQAVAIAIHNRMISI
jgi:LuxR family transcriptional regulator, quorum-sensing system regulator BjaR1